MWNSRGEYDIMVKMKMPPIRCFLVLPLLAAPAMAQDAPSRTLQLFPQGVEHCYAARFDETYRKAHPGQTLTEFMIYRSFQPKPETESVELPAAEQIALNKDEGSTPWVSVLAKLAGDGQYYDQAPSCYDSDERGDVFCGVDCDGGSFRVKKSGDGLAVSFEDSYGLSLNQSCGDPDEDSHGHLLTPEEAGGGFALASLPRAVCIAADAEARPAFAADPMPLRERIALQGWRCLSRVYDQDHLKQHPKQTVAAIALAIAGPAKASKDEANWMTTTIEANLSLRLVDGKTSSKPVTCTADGYQFRCGGDFRLRRRDHASALLLAGEYGGEENPATAIGLNGLQVGPDDKVFKLDASAGADCSAR